MNIYVAIPLIAAIIYISLLVVLITHRPWRKRHKLFVWFLAGAILWSASNVLFRSDFLLEYKLVLARITICSFLFMMVPFCYFVTTFYSPPRDTWVPLAYIPLLSSIVLSIFNFLPKEINFGPSVYLPRKPDFFR